jgi:glycerate 2-kinase
MRGFAHRALSAPPVAVCAPNAFKGSLSARSAATALALGAGDAGAQTTVVPVADGGDGTLDVLLAASVGSVVTRQRVTGPNGPPVTARLGRLATGAAVVELAEASGLRLVRPGDLDALHATSRGTGELIRLALDAGCSRIVVGVGGSACTDGGAGLLQALGAHLTDSRGSEIGPGGAGLEDLERIDLSEVHPALARCSIEVACDIRSPLLGADGPAHMFAAQKGANPAAIGRLERALEHLVAVAGRAGDRGLAELPGAGAAGGCGFGLALIGARLMPGAKLVCDMVGLDAALAGATIAITGEGRLDEQTRTGKAPAEVAARARALGVSCVAICGTVIDPLPDLFDAAVALDRLDPAVDPMRHTRALLRRAAAGVTREALAARSQ